MGPYGPSAAPAAAGAAPLAYTGVNTLSMVLLAATLIMCGVLARRIAKRTGRAPSGS